MGLLVATIALTAISVAIPMSFADKPESDQDGWGEVTSELATSDSEEDDDEHPDGLVGEHSRANGDFPDSEPPFDDDGEEGRSGLGNVAGGGQNIHDLGCFLADIDDNEDTGC